MADLNNAIFTGRLTDDPELNQLSNGSFVCHFTIACNRRKDNNGENKTDFILVAAYKTTAEIVSRNFCKGKEICLKKYRWLHRMKICTMKLYVRMV